MRFALALLLTLVAIESASACNRCRRNPCVYTKYVAPVVQQIVADSPDVYVIQNSYPSPLIPQGSSLYQSTGHSYQGAVLPFMDPNRYFEQELQLLRAANETSAIRSERASALVSRIAELQAPAVERLAAGQAAQMVLQAAGLDPAHNTGGTQQAVVISRDAHGQLQVLPLNAAQVALAMKTQIKEPIADGAPPPPVAVGKLTQFCGKCHGIDVAQPKAGFYLGDDLNVAKGMKAKFFEITQQITARKMPPAKEPQPTNEERAAILDEVQSIILGKGESK